MPDLVLFLPCDLPIIDQGTNNLTLVNVRTSMEVPGVGAQNRMNFAIVTIWRPSPDETGAAMFQRITLEPPEGEPASVETPFTFEGRENRLTLRIQGFPLPVAGVYRLSVHVRREDGEYPDAPAQVFDMRVNVRPQSAA